MYTIESLPGRTARINGEEWLYFSGTAYLGVVRDDRFRALVKEGVDRYGLHYGGSRLAAIRLPLFATAEALLCRLTGAPAALTVSSGTMAGQLVVRQLAHRHTCFFGPDIHPALWPENYEPTPYTFREWSHFLTQNATPALPAYRPPWLILTNALDSLRVRPYDFSWLEQLPTGIPVTVVIDDSHGFGITGAEGAGIFPELKAPENVRLIVISSLGKAFGIPGGVILGPPDILATLAKSPFFGGASPVSPAFLHAFIEGQEIYRENRETLRRNIRQFAAAIKDSAPPLESFDNYPAFFTPENELAAFLASHRVLISSFPYPTPNDAPLTRIVLNSLHTRSDIDRLVELVVKYGQK